jgi:hypothetical protein
MAIHLDLMRRSERVEMKGLLGGLVVAVALASLGSDASAALTDGAAPDLVAKAGSRHHAVTIAKAKKRKRPASSGSAGKGESTDDAAGGDDDSGKSASASSDAGDDAKEDAVLGPAKKKKAPVAASEDGDSSSSGRSGGGDDDSKAASKSVETVSSKASSEEPGAGATLSALEFGVGAKAMFRQLAWTSDARAAGLGPYTLTPGPETGAWLEFYPAAFGSQGFAANIGLFGRFDYGFGVATTLADHTDAATSFRDYLGGIKVRIPTGTFIPNVSVAYGQQVFEIAQQQNAADLPKLAYQFIRPALGARILLSPTIALDAAVAYLMVLDAGSGTDQLKSSRFFPKATSYGIDASASVAVKVTESIGVRGGADFRQYGIDLHPDSTTRSVAGAVDRYIVAWAGLEVVLDGQGGAAGGDDEPAKPSKRRRRHASSSDEASSSDSEDESKDSSKSSSEDE